MMTSRTIGYQEKKEKQSTAPIRNVQAPALRLARGSSDTGRRPRAAGAAAARRATLVRTLAIRFSCPLWRWPGRVPGRAAEVAARPALG